MYPLLCIVFLLASAFAQDPSVERDNILATCDLNALSPSLKLINNEYKSCFNQYFIWGFNYYRVRGGAKICNDILKGKCNSLAEEEDVRQCFYYSNLPILDLSTGKDFPVYVCIPTTCDLQNNGMKYIECQPTIELLSNTESPSYSVF